MSLDLELTLDDGHKVKVDLFWLRDHCRCDLCYNIHNSNRIGKILEIADDISIKEHWIDNGKLLVVWNDEHKSEYKLKFLTKYQPLKKIPMRTPLKLWDKEGFKPLWETECRFNVADFLNDSEVKINVLKSLHVHGAVFIDGCEATQDYTELIVTQLFPIAKTFFGEFFTFSEAAQDHHDTAYTNVYLAPHNDHTYFNDQAGLLVLHCIHHNGNGGESFLVDSYQVAEKIKKENPASYERLTKTIVGAEYKEAGRHHKWAAPMFNLDPITGEMLQIRYNMDDRLPLTTVPADGIRDFYHDLKLLTRELQSDENTAVFKLRPGTILHF